MKEATGELSMTVIVIVAVIAILAIVSAFLLPQMKSYIISTWGDLTGQACSEDSNGQLKCEKNG